MIGLLRRLAPLLGIITLAWMLVLLGSVIIFGYIAPLKLPGEEVDPLPSAIAKVAFAATLALAWILILYALTLIYARRALIRPS